MSALRTAGLWALRFWIVTGWVFFVPVLVVRLMSAAFHHFGA